VSPRFDERVSEVSRRLRSRCDAINGAIWFMPQARSGFTELGLSPAATSWGGRAACLGPVRGEVAAALFAPINPLGIPAAVEEAWSRSTPEAILHARVRHASAFLADVLGPEPDSIGRAVELLWPVANAGPTEGHPVYAGLRTLGRTGGALGDLWRASEMVRERRGDSHRNAWVAAGLDPVELAELTDRWRGGSAFNSASGTWPEEDRAGARARLRDRGLLDARDQLTDAGRELRDAVELATDRQERTLVEALGDDVDELFALLAPWARAVVDVGVQTLATAADASQ
jgi:hypothetical protein